MNLRRLFAPVTAQDFLHRTLQIVVTQDFEDTAEESKCLFMSFQKSLLGRPRIGTVKRCAAYHAAHRKHLQFRRSPPRSAYASYQSTWASTPQRYDLGNEDFLMFPPKLRPSAGERTVGRLTPRPGGPASPFSVAYKYDERYAAVCVALSDP